MLLLRSRAHYQDTVHLIKLLIAKSPRVPHNAALYVGPQQGALHFVAEAADPRSALRVARTYFLSQGALVKDIFAGESAIY
jgi:hypothetical protein